MIDKPTLGDIVHFVFPDRSECAAIVTNPLDSNTVNLHLFLDHGKMGSHNGQAVPFDSTHRISPSWHWPERAPALLVDDPIDRRFEPAVVNVKSSRGLGIYTGNLMIAQTSEAQLVIGKGCIIYNGPEMGSTSKNPYLVLHPEREVILPGLVIGSAADASQLVVLVSSVSLVDPAPDLTSTAAIARNGDADRTAGNDEDAGKTNPINPVIPPAENIGSQPAPVEVKPETSTPPVDAAGKPIVVEQTSTDM